MTTPDKDVTKRTLKDLGPGGGSTVERIKLQSNFLRGNIAEELCQDTSHFSEDQTQLIKFHGMYQQEDRDARQSRKEARQEKAYQFMVRSRIPGGALSPEQYIVQDDLASRYGNGTLRFTTRQSIQLYGILKGDIYNTIHRINEALLSTKSACGDVNRNVMACPASSTDLLHQQLQALAQEIALHLAPRSNAYHELWINGEKTSTVGGDVEEEPLYGPTYLPRKFKIGIISPEDNCIDVYTQDLGLVVLREGEELKGFTLLIGGGMGMTHGKVETHPCLALPFCDTTVDEVMKVIETIVTVQRDYGDRQNRRHARMKYVVEERGIPWFRAEVEQRLGYRLSQASPVHIHGVQDHLGWHQQSDGNWFLGLHVTNGRVKDTPQMQLKTGLRRVIEHFRPGIRLTAQQNILLTDVPGEQRVSLEAELQAYGISADPVAAGSYRFAMACPALPTCSLAIAEAERVLPTVVQEIEADLRTLGLDNEPISIRMTGCPNGCARPYMGDIGLVGRSKGLYNLYLGGDLENTRLNELYAIAVPQQQIVSLLHPLFVFWKEERTPNEAFGDFCHRLGLEQLRTKSQH